MYTEYQTSEENIQITDANLERINKKISRILIMRKALLSEKVRLFRQTVCDEDGLSADSVRSEESFEFFHRITQNQGSDFGSDVLRSDIEPSLFSTLFGTLDKIEICRWLSCSSSNGRPFQQSVTESFLERLLVESDRNAEDYSPLDTPAVRPLGERIAYVKNSYSDIVFSKFSSCFSRCTSAYYPDYTGLCEAVAYGNATSCILPIENSTDGKLTRFYSLIERYDLRIILTLEIPSHDGETVTKYALLRRLISIPRFVEGEKFFFECNINLGDDLSLSDILLAASAYRLRLVRADSRFQPFMENGSSYNLVFLIEKGDVCAMVTYLYLQVPQFTPIGVYRLLA